MNGPHQVLMLKWPGGLESPTPGPCSSKEDMEAMGYVRRPQSDHIQRGSDVRDAMVFEHKFYDGPIWARNSRYAAADPE